MQQKAAHLIQRYNPAATWMQYDPILLEGEIGIESDTGKVKFGDGEHQWSQLDYFIDMEEFQVYSAGDGMTMDWHGVLDATLLYDVVEEIPVPIPWAEVVDGWLYIYQAYDANVSDGYLEIE